MSIDSKSLNVAMVSGPAAQSNAAAINKSTPVKKSSNFDDPRSTSGPNSNYAQRVTSDVNSNSAAIAASTYTAGPKFNPYLFPYMPQQMSMPSMSSPQTSTPPKIAQTGGGGSADEGEGGGGGGGGGGGHVPDGGFNGAVPPNGDKEIGAFKKEEAPKKEEPKAETKEEKNPKVEDKAENVQDKAEDSKPKTFASLDVGFGEFS